MEGRERERYTKIIDVEHAAHGAACSAMSNLGLAGRGWCIINGRVDLGQGGQGLLHFNGHDGLWIDRSSVVVVVVESADGMIQREMGEVSWVF